MNSFYKQPIFLQWFEAILLLSIGFYPVILIIELANENPIFSLLFLIYLPISQFTLTPIFKLTGVYRYYSPMLLGYMANNIQIDIHSGGSFDYLFVMRNCKTGVESRNRILIYHLEGLLNIISKIENGEIPENINVCGTSYFFNERSVKKFGFELIEPSIFYRFNLLVNFIDLIWMFSVSQGKFSIPKIWKAKKITIVGHKLVENKENIMALYNKMTSKLLKINPIQNLEQ